MFFQTVSLGDENWSLPVPARTAYTMTPLSLTHNSFWPERLWLQALCIAQPVRLHLVAPVPSPRLSVPAQPESFVKALTLIYKLDKNHSAITLLYRLWLKERISVQPPQKITPLADYFHSCTLAPNFLFESCVSGFRSQLLTLAVYWRDI